MKNKYLPESVSQQPDKTFPTQNYGAFLQQGKQNTRSIMPSVYNKLTSQTVEQNKMKTAKLVEFSMPKYDISLEYSSISV